MSVKFLYMDEKLVDVQAPSIVQVTSLTGILLPAESYADFRTGFFRLLPGIREGIVPEGHISVHASDLFPDLTESEHFNFYEGLVSLVNELKLKIYRRGFNFSPSHHSLRQNQKTMLWYCFRGILLSLESELSNSQVWPVMEIDHTDEQDRIFAEYIWKMDCATIQLSQSGDGVGPLIEDGLIVDNENLGEVHYVTKRSIVGSAVDCLSYLLHYKWVHSTGYSLSEYKKRLADIALNLQPSTLAEDCVAEYRLGVPGQQPFKGEK